MVFNKINDYLAQIGAELDNLDNKSKEMLDVTDRIKPVVSELTQAYAMLEKMIQDDPSQREKAKEIIIEMNEKCNSMLDSYRKENSQLLNTIQNASKNNLVLPESLYQAAQDIGMYIKKLEDIAEKYNKYVN